MRVVICNDHVAMCTKRIARDNGDDVMRGTQSATLWMALVMVGCM